MPDCGSSGDIVSGCKCDLLVQVGRGGKQRMEKIIRFAGQTYKQERPQGVGLSETPRGQNANAD